VHFKLESQMPTGSFKDRGTAVILNHLLQVGVGPIHEDSSGNAGSSIASYAAAAGIRCRIYVPVSAPRGKIVQIAASGAEVRVIPGTRQAVTEAALAAVDDSFYASHNWHPFFIEGTKTLPTNCGSSSASGFLTTSCADRLWQQHPRLDRGFDELQRRGGSPEGRASTPCRPRKAALFLLRLPRMPSPRHRRRRHRYCKAGADA
jgi:hypothetical protein